MEAPGCYAPRDPRSEGRRNHAGNTLRPCVVFDIASPRGEEGESCSVFRTRVISNGQCHTNLTLHGRIWVTPEVNARYRRYISSRAPSSAHLQPDLSRELLIADNLSSGFRAGGRHGPQAEKA